MPSADHHEVERAYAVGPDDQLPDFHDLPGVAAVDEPDTVDLVAGYLDTADLALIRSGVTLRRREGGADAGWHLKIPAGGGRDEVHRPLGRSGAVPRPLARTVLGWTRGRPVAPVAVIATRRTTTLLRADDGTVLAEVADDAVLGTPSDGAPASAWREVEVELVTAAPAFLDAVDELFATVGIEPSREQRKIGTVLAHRLDAERVVPEPAAADREASRVLHLRLVEQVAELLRRDADVRRGVDDGVHQLRVTCRRLRGLLATYRPAFDREVTDPIRDELRWVARTLGDGRDAEVMRDRLRGLIAAEPRRLVVGPVRRRVDRHFAERLRAAGGHAMEVLASRRYLRLLARLDRLVDATPWTDAASRPAAEVLLPRVARDLGRLRRRVEDAALLDALGDAAHDEALHDVRKAAKRLRYGCEVLEPVWGDDAKTLRKAAQEVTRVLGDRNDAAVTRLHLRRIAVLAQAAGEATFTYGLLHAREEESARGLLDDFEQAWQVVDDPSLRGWLQP